MSRLTKRAPGTADSDSASHGWGKKWVILRMQQSHAWVLMRCFCEVTSVLVCTACLEKVGLPIPEAAWLGALLGTLAMVWFDSATTAKTEQDTNWYVRYPSEDRNFLRRYRRWLRVEPPRHGKVATLVGRLRCVSPVRAARSGVSCAAYAARVPRGRGYELVCAVGDVYLETESQGLFRLCPGRWRVTHPFLVARDAEATLADGCQVVVDAVAEVRPDAEAGYRGRAVSWVLRPHEYSVIGPVRSRYASVRVWSGALRLYWFPTLFGAATAAAIAAWWPR
ncbi:MAG: hypothetical protein IT373_34695 [Polyangiaceae bacterium]|nr:hypothetical protein [Polyangiaceae bacterium]